MIQTAGSSALVRAQAEIQRRQHEDLDDNREYFTGEELPTEYGKDLPKRKGKYFGANDTGAALLTWAAQVDPDSKDEVFALRCRIVYEIEGVYRMEEDHEPDYESEYELPVLCALIQRVMDTLHEKGGIKKTDFENIETWRAGIAADDQERPWTFTGLGEEEGVIPLYELRAHYSPPGDYDAAFVFKRFDSFIGEVINGEASIARCPECSNLYHISAARRNQQVFCSHRCADRAGQRRRRNKL